MPIQREVKTDTWVERNSVTLNSALLGTFGEKAWRGAVYAVASGNVPGGEFESVYLDESVIPPHVVCGSLVEGALKKLDRYTLLNDIPDPDNERTADVGVALATAVIWAYQHSLDVDRYLEEINTKIESGMRRLKNADDRSMYLFKLTQLFEIGLSQFPEETIRRTTQRNTDIYRMLFIGERMRHTALDEKHDGPAVFRWYTTRTVNLYPQARQAYALTAAELMRDQGKAHPWQVQTPESKKELIEWKQSILKITPTVTSGMPPEHAIYLVYAPILAQIPFADEQVREWLVENMLLPYHNKSEALRKLIGNIREAYGDPRLVLLLLRGLSPDSKVANKTIAEIRKAGNDTFNTETAMLYAYWEAHAALEDREEMRIRIADLFRLYSREQRKYAVAQSVRYMPRMMTVAGGLEVSAIGLSSSAPGVREEASAGLLAAIHAWKKRKGTTGGELARVNIFLDEYAGLIDEDRLARMVDAVAGYSFT